MESLSSVNTYSVDLNLNTCIFATIDRIHMGFSVLGLEVKNKKNFFLHLMTYL